MPEVIDLYEFFSAVSAIILISFFVTIAWMSTYVRDQPVVATAVVVFQQDLSTNTSTSRTQNMNTSSGETPSESGVQTPEGEQLMSTSTFVEDVESEESSESTPITEECEELEKESKPESSDQSNSNQNYSGISGLDIRESDIKVHNNSKDNSVTTGSQQERKHTEEEIIASTSSNNSEAPSSDISAEAEVQYEEISEESIRIKLRFVDDTQRMVRGSLTDEVGSFKRANFDPELSSNRVVRLIFNGQLLNRDRSTLGQYGLFDNCVVHCHISQPQPLNSNERSDIQESEGLDLSEILSPMLLVVIALLWYLRYEYSYIFNTSATIILVFLTALLLISQFAFTVNLELSLGYGNSGNDRRTSPGSPRQHARESEPRIERNPESISPRTPTRNVADIENIPDRHSDHQTSENEAVVPPSRSDNLACSRTPAHQSFTDNNHRPRLNPIQSNS